MITKPIIGRIGLILSIALIALIAIGSGITTEKTGISQEIIPE